MTMRVPLDFLWLTILAACAMPTLGQNAPLAVRPGSRLAPSAASIPDFSGIWGHPSNGRKLSVLKTSMNIMREKTQADKPDF
jgi:hypothetical protein